LYIPTHGNQPLTGIKQDTAAWICSAEGKRSGPSTEAADARPRPCSATVAGGGRRTSPPAAGLESRGSATCGHLRCGLAAARAFAAEGPPAPEKTWPQATARDGMTRNKLGQCRFRPVSEVCETTLILSHSLDACKIAIFADMLPRLIFMKFP